MNDYDKFIETKTRRAQSHGFEPLPITAPLFEWQAHVLRWAVRQGRAALFEDCGLGKTAQQLEWASQVCRKTGGNPKPVTKDPAKYPVDWWQEVASPVWMTVDQGRVLNRDGARDDHDERHICPLQLDVIERAVTLWSNEGDLVYSPFTGIGSEGVSALELNRRFVGSELKESYFKQACQNMQNARSQLTLF